jgi:hypothetical protein
VFCRERDYLAIGELANVASVTAEPGAKAAASTPTSTAPSIALASAASVTEAVAERRHVTVTGSHPDCRAVLIQIVALQPRRRIGEGVKFHPTAFEVWDGSTIKPAPEPPLAQPAAHDKPTS